MEDLLFHILRLALGTNAIPLRALSEKEWDKVFQAAEKHSLTGLAFAGVQKLVDMLINEGIPESEIIPIKFYLEWLGIAYSISQQNETIDTCSKEVQAMFHNEGFETCILKGRGVARYYGEFSDYRQSGDIDIWVWPKGSWTLNHDERMKAVLQFLRPKYECGAPTYHHNVGFVFSKDIVVEAHYTPSWMFSPLHNHRLQKWFESQARTEMQNDFSTLEFNRIYILLHIYRHLFGEGVGLRQIVDYYFVLHYRRITEDERRQTMALLKSFGAGKFTAALMWILHRKLGLATDCLLCEPDGIEGAFLLSEVLQSGNFGQYDTRIDRRRNKGKLAVFSMRVRRNFRFVTHYPSEVLWCPLWKVWHQLWLRSFKF